jgi:hypothetical protein
MMKKLAVALLLILIAAALVLGHYRWEENFRCELCLSQKSVSEWRLGAQPLGYPIFGSDKPFTFRSIQLTKPVEHVSPSVATRLFPPEHRHEWSFAQGAPYYLFGQKQAGSVVGTSRQASPFAYAFLNEPEFRAYVEELMRSNRLSQSQAVNMFVFDPGREGRLDPRYKRGMQMVRGFLVTHPNRTFEESFKSAFGGR